MVNRFNRISASRQRDEIIAIFDYLKAHTPRQSVSLEELGLLDQHMDTFNRFLSHGLVEVTNSHYYLVRRQPPFRMARRREFTFQSLFEGFGDKNTQMILRPILIMVAVVMFLAIFFMILA